MHIKQQKSCLPFGITAAAAAARAAPTPTPTDIGFLFVWTRAVALLT